MDDAQKQLDERLAALTEADEAFWYNEECRDRLSWDFGKTQEEKDKIIEGVRNHVYTEKEKETMQKFLESYRLQYPQYFADVADQK